MTIISSFTGDHKFLSNFYPVGINLDGEVYPTVEHAFQAAKTDVGIERANIRVADSPSRVKWLGRRATLRTDWEETKLDVMEALLRKKFVRPDLAVKLALTTGSMLIEDNTWYDRYWGMCKGTGENHLGRLLMKIRDEEKI